jgi:hypothetical protein
LTRHGKARLGSVEPRWKEIIAQNIMKVAELESKLENQTRLSREFCIVLYIKVVEGGGINASPIHV